MTSEQRQFITRAREAARIAGFAFPTMVACEAAEESAFGRSLLAIQSNNLFGMKQHVHATYHTVNLPSREYEANGEWDKPVSAFVNYPDWPSCFADRLATLERLSNVYPDYRTALDAPDPQTYIWAVSKTWSTDPKRAQKVFNIYQDFLTLNPEDKDQDKPAPEGGPGNAVA